MDPPGELFSVQDVYFYIPNDIALELQMDERIVFSGRIKEVVEFFRTVSIYLEDVTLTRVSKTPRPTATPVPKVVPFKQEFQTGGWKWHLYDVKKIKTVYWYGNPTTAQGNYLLVFIQFTNVSSGTAYPYRIEPFYLVDGKGNKHSLLKSVGTELEASIAAGWQFQAATIWEDFQPGEILGTVVAWDLPDGSGDIFLHLGGIVIYLGNFDEMPLTK